MPPKKINIKFLPDYKRYIYVCWNVSSGDGINREGGNLLVIIRFHIYHPKHFLYNNYDSFVCTPYKTNIIAMKLSLCIATNSDFLTPIIYATQCTKPLIIRSKYEFVR